MAVAPEHSLVFFGSGPVAAASLERLVKNFEVEAVVTKPQPPHHKDPFPVLELAEKLGLKVFTPFGKKELSALFATQPVKSRLGVVIDYGFIINQDVIDYFPLGIVNSHFSLLPEWRGADPITFSILSGQKQTGISLMLINDKMDEGPLLAQATYDIEDDETTPSLTERLIDLSDQTLQHVLPAYLKDEIQPAPQQDASIAASKEPTYSRKLTKEDGAIDWQKPAETIEREIRAFIEWPKSHTQLGKQDIIIITAHVRKDVTGNLPGKVELLGKEILVHTADGCLVIDQLKPAGKQEMSAEAFLAGYRNTLD